MCLLIIPFDTQQIEIVYSPILNCSGCMRVKEKEEEQNWNWLLEDNLSCPAGNVWILSKIYDIIKDQGSLLSPSSTGNSNTSDPGNAAAEPEGTPKQ